MPASAAPPLGLAVQVAALVLSVLGLFSLSTLLLTVALVDEIRRHPVFLNFLCIWMVWSIFESLSSLTAIAMPTYQQFDISLVMYSTVRDILWVATQAATLNFVIHLWFTMRTSLRGEGCLIRVKLRTLVLLITPYLIAIVPLGELFYPHGIFFGVSTRVSLQPIFLALTVITVILDVSLLLVFRKNHRILRQAEIHEGVSIALLVRLLLFCITRLIFTAFCVLYLAETSSNVAGILIQISESSNPLLVFLLLGMRRDNLRVWLRLFGKTYPNPESEVGGASITHNDSLGVSRFYDTSGASFGAGWALSKGVPAESTEFESPSTINHPTYGTEAGIHFNTFAHCI